MRKDSKTESKSDSKLEGISKRFLFYTVIAGFAITTIFTMAVGIVGIIYLRNIDNANTRLYRDGVVNAHYSAEITEAFAELRASVRDMVVETNPDRLRRFKRNFDRWRGQMIENQKKLLESVQHLPYRKKIAENMSEAMEIFFKNVDIAVENAIAGRKAEAWQNMNDGRLYEARRNLGNAADEMKDVMLAQIIDDAQSSASTVNRFQLLIIVLMSVALLVAVACSIFIKMTIFAEDKES
ncbi:MAG: MCP four helix bundle domain-containing protein [Holophagales bacterium]|jgi:methyl-accepting chemotaxis protein|nr:MCP four helix bundle domain-containing protein [Holophagales bacterium]